nr:hypothetical protein [Tanacetum cinerariifolium]
MKKRPQTEAQARRNMMMYLKNTVGFRMDYFKGMSYDDIRPIFEAKFNSNIEFLLKTKEQIEEEENRAIAIINETPAQKAAKRRRLNEETEDVEELKQHLEIVPDEDDDVKENQEKDKIGSKPDKNGKHSLERRYFPKTRSVPKTNVSEGLSKQVTVQTLPQAAKKAVSNTNVHRPGMYRIDNRTTHTRAPQLPKNVRNTNLRVSTSTGVNHKPNVSRPQLKSNQSRDKVLPNNSQMKVKNTQVEVHPRIPSVSNKMKSVTACKDSLNSRTLNANDTEFEKYKAFNDRTVDCDKLELVKEKHDELIKQSLLTKSHYEGLFKQKTKVITDLKLREEHNIDKMLSMEKQLKFLNEIVYKRSQSIQTIHMMAPKVPTYNGRPTFANLRYRKQAQSEIPCLYAFPCHQSTHANKLIPDGEETLVLERESRSKLNKDLVQIVDNAWIKHSKDQFRAPTAQDMEILIQTCLMPLAIKTQNDNFLFVHELKQEMHTDLKYVESLEKDIDELESDKAEFSNMYDMIQECVSKDVMCSYLLSLSDLDALDELQCLYLHKVKECDCLAQKLTNQTDSVSKEVHSELLKCFAKVEKHSISLEMAFSNSRTSNVNAVCATCNKCLVDSNHIACVTKMLNDVNARTKKPNVVPISTRKPKGHANKSVATPHKKKVASKPNNQKPYSYFRMLYEKTSKTWKWWIAQQSPSGYKWVPKTKMRWVPKIKMQWVPKAKNENVQKRIVQLILFIINSGCTKHMTGNLKLLCNFVEKFLGTVHFGNDQFAPILGYGDLVQGNVTINRVYYVEGLNHNLFSVGQFCEADLEVAFRKSTCFVRDLQGNDLLTGNRGSDLYTISLKESTSSTPLCLMAKASPTQAWLWHRRLSHLNFDYINLLLKKDIVIGLPKLKYVNNQLCSSCKLSKAKRSSFKSKVILSLKGRLNLLHMDLCGPMRVASINGKKYILVIVDDYSRYTWTLFLRFKDKTPEVLKEFLTVIQRNL